MLFPLHNITTTMSTTIKEIPNEVLENILDYLNSNEDKVSTFITSKATRDDPYLKEYIKKWKEDTNTLCK